MIKRLFLVNPQAGKGRAKRIWNELSLEFQSQGISYDVYLTTAPGEAEQYARTYSAHYDQVIAVGGDGTLHEVINGIHGIPVKLGLIPAGTGNDFARFFNWTDHIKEAADRILNDRYVHVDLIKIKDRVFINAAGMGFDAKVARHVNTSPHIKRLGALGYVVSVLKQLPAFKPGPVTVEVDGNTHQFSGTYLIAVANARSYGGGMKIAPDADCKDGLLDICVVYGLSKWELLTFFPKVFSGSHTDLPMVKMLRGKKVTIEAPDGMVLHADGEILVRPDGYSTSETFEVLPSELQVLI